MEWFISITPGEDTPDLDWSVKDETSRIVLSAIGKITVEDASYWLDDGGYTQSEIDAILLVLRKLDLVG